MDKEIYAVNEAPESPDSNGLTNYNNSTIGSEAKTGRNNEAAAIYGDIETAEEYGYVTRGYVHMLTYWALADQVTFQTKVSAHPIHRARWYYWHRSLPWYRKCLHSRWSPICTAWLLFYRLCRICYDDGTGKWQLGFLYPVPFLSFVPDMWTMLWGLRSDGT